MIPFYFTSIAHYHHTDIYSLINIPLSFGLQTALDLVGLGGRVVLGSLFGEGAVPLRLGMRFHRSGVSLQASQVSLVPPELSTRWTKERRFGLAWDLVRAIRPSRLLLPAEHAEAGEEGAAGAYEDTTATEIPCEAVSLESKIAQEVYERLDRGDIITALFKYI